MEPLEWIIGLVLLYGGYEVFGKEEVTVSADTEVKEVIQSPITQASYPIYIRGRYYKTNNGYYISNLTPAPVEFAGCYKPVLTANLEKPRESEKIDVIAADTTCER